MGKTWKTPEQSEFLQALVPKYLRDTDGGKRKEFWEETFEAWFERFPLAHPSPDATTNTVSEQLAVKKAKANKIRVSEARNRILT